ncbi:hypothetical protein AB1Y20_019319 [Prymnesium parvum]|uniref:Uncharacterized protein n=1 Tax=Prymnesium parvum TaxID=97485 RepID=A0AB34JVJ1_PRYPA
MEPRPKVFFPRQAQQSPSGYLVGWNPHSFLCTVATIAPSSLPLVALEQALALIASDPRLQTLIAHCGGAPSVLGVWLHAQDDERRALASSERAQVAELWLSLVGQVDQASEYTASPSLAPALPTLRDVHCCGCRYRTSMQLVFFERARFDSAGYSPPSFLPQWQSFESSPMSLPSDSDRLSELDYTLRHVSCSAEFGAALEWTLRSLTPSPGSLQGVAPPVSLGRVYCGRTIGVDSRHGASGGTTASATGHAAHMPRLVLRALVVCATAAARACTWLLRAEPVAGYSFLTMSLAARQLDCRIANAVDWPRRWQAVRDSPPWQQRTRTEWLRLQGELFGALLDSMLGLLLALALWSYFDPLCETVSVAHAHISDSCEKVVHWLMGVDSGGFKLNENLNRAIGTCVLSLLQVWRALLRGALLALPPARQVVTFLSYSCLLGSSFGIAVVSDLLALFSFHVVQMYLVMSIFYATYMSALYTLFNLFRGQKLNVLRDRVDSCDYDHEQLLLGTLLFTVLVFLLPTVAAYYGLATLMRMALLGVQVHLMAVVRLLDGFPWFALLQYLFRPNRLHTGVQFQPLQPAPALQSSNCTTYFELLSQPASMAPFIAWFRRLFTLLVGSYTARHVSCCLLFGQTIHPVRDCRSQLRRLDTALVGLS